MIEPNYELMVKLVQTEYTPLDEMEAASLLECTYWGTSDFVRHSAPDLYENIINDSFDLRKEFDDVQAQCKTVLAGYAMEVIREELRNGTRQP